MWFEERQKLVKIWIPSRLNEPSLLLSIAWNTNLANELSVTPKLWKNKENSSAAMPPSLLVSMASKINGKVAEIAALFDSSNKAYCCKIEKKKLKIS